MLFLLVYFNNFCNDPTYKNLYLCYYRFSFKLDIINTINVISFLITNVLNIIDISRQYRCVYKKKLLLLFKKLIIIIT